MPRTRVYDDVPKDEVGEKVQLSIDAGATKVVVELNDDNTTCTVTVTKP